MTTSDKPKSIKKIQMTPALVIVFVNFLLINKIKQNFAFEFKLDLAINIQIYRYNF